MEPRNCILPVQVSSVHLCKHVWCNKEVSQVGSGFFCNLMTVSFNQVLSVVATLKKMAMWPVLRYISFSRYSFTCREETEENDTRN